jgi:hypothetical protein
VRMMSITSEAGGVISLEVDAFSSLAM